MKKFAKLPIICTLLAIPSLSFASSSLTNSTSITSTNSFMTITSAFYGASEMGASCNATALVAQMCDGTSACEVISDTALCEGSDPAPWDTEKELVVNYECGDSGPLVQNIKEDNRGKIRCPGTT